MFSILALIAIQTAPAAPPAQGNHKVEVDGQTYRVFIKGRKVSAFNKSIVVMRTPERGDSMRKAVIAATGCRMKDEYWEGSHLTGLLDCGAAATQ